MSTSQVLTMVAMACLSASAFLARHHLRQRRGLRFVFAGLLIAGSAGVGISFSSSLVFARLLSIPMLTGMAFAVRGIQIEKLSRTNDAVL